MTSGGQHEEDTAMPPSAEAGGSSGHGMRNKPTPIAPALIAVQPGGPTVVVATGAALRVYNLLSAAKVILTDATEPRCHGDAVRTISFDTCGDYFASGGDDKVVKLWDARTWTCLWTSRVPKKLSAVSFSLDSRHLFFADKYGVVSVVPTAGGGVGVGVGVGEGEPPPQLLAHCCTIITCMAVSPDGALVATGDRDFKARVSCIPRDPRKGAPEIASFCLGHTLFVTCVAFTRGSARDPSGLLVSGGGDGTVRLWDPANGCLLQTLDFDSPPHPGEEKEKETSSCRSVVALAVAGDGATVAVGMERTTAVLLLYCEVESRMLTIRQRIEFIEKAPPTSLAFDSGKNIWISAGGVEALETDDSEVTPQALAAAEIKAQNIAGTAKVRVRVLGIRGRNGAERVAEVSRDLLSPGGGGVESGANSANGANGADGGNAGVQGGGNGHLEGLDGAGVAEMGISAERILPPGRQPAKDEAGAMDDNREGGGGGGGGGYEVIADAVVPGGAEMLRHLQGCLEGAIEAAAKAAEASDVGRNVDLNKRTFTRDERELRKRTRNDKK